MHMHTCAKICILSEMFLIHIRAQACAISLFLPLYCPVTVFHDPLIPPTYFSPTSPPPFLLLPASLPSLWTISISTTNLHKHRDSSRCIAPSCPKTLPSSDCCLMPRPMWMPKHAWCDVYIHAFGGMRFPYNASLIFIHEYVHICICA